MQEKFVSISIPPNQIATDKPAPAVSSSSLDDLEDDLLALRGDADSFVQLYRRYLRPVYAYLYARLGNQQEAEDVASLTFERAWNSLHHYVPTTTGSFRGWLFTIANRALADYFRNKKPPSVELDSLADLLFDAAAGPEERAVAAEQLRQVGRVLQTLSAEQREIITLRFLAELRYSEIAEVLGKREAAVKMAAYRGLDAVRRAIAAQSED